ncbi:GNAT family N-acetyltransferase [Streptomyces sp. CHD11]|uniref:GNAT family N-acetyltransferase n=1 Tax=Streptomyces sp. CHD11 TaxID=2741325 RepID=UPI001BFC49C8|nr:GNAT family N-acetyltransferase [Streptomyces sp. CHD11]MBT3154748.1 GNAT family N-acetyltransferase [Streptomyces sp. CHD11]
MSSSPEHLSPSPLPGPPGAPGPPELPELPELRGDGLRLCAWDPESRADVEAWLRGLTDPEFRRWNTPLRPITDEDSARESLRRAARRDADGTAASFRVADLDTGTVLGHIGVNEIHPVMLRGTVGYWVLPEARGRGVATRALLLAAHWAFTERGLHRLELDHAIGHEASCRIAERCGFRYEGTVRGAILAADRRDAFRDAHLHARLAPDPEPVRRPATAT